MRVFEPNGQEESEFALTIGEDGDERLTAGLDPSTPSSKWTPVHVRLVTRTDDGRPRTESDAPGPPYDVLFFRSRAALALGPILQSHGDLLPLRCDKAQLFAFKPRFILDALDEEASTVWRFTPSGRIGHIYKHVFWKDVIGNHWMFGITSLDPSPVYVTEEFVQAWKDAGLRGLKFKLVWEG